MTRRSAIVILAAGVLAAVALAGCTADRFDPENREDVQNDTQGAPDAPDPTRPQPGDEPTMSRPTDEFDDNARINDGFGPR